MDSARRGGVVNPTSLSDEENKLWFQSKIDPILANNSWNTIAKAFKNGENPDTWVVGDTKSVTTKTGITYTIRLCDMQSGRYTYADGSGGNKAVFEFVELVKIGNLSNITMNNANKNTDGWKTCTVRSNLDIFKDILPDGLVSIISNVNVLSGIGDGTTQGTSSSVNKLFVSAEAEIFPYSTYSVGISECPLGQFDYYRINDGNSYRIKCDVGSENGRAYWIRSPRIQSSTSYCRVSNNGMTSYDEARKSYGVSPIFAI